MRRGLLITLAVRCAGHLSGRYSQQSR